MKTAEEWAVERENAPDELTIESSRVSFKFLIEAVQLDAMKEGMRRAANLEMEHLSGVGGSPTILTAAEQLTEKRLLKATEESPEIYRYPFDDKNPFSNTMVKYHDSYACYVYCANCKYNDRIRIKNGVAKDGLTYKCNNCKVYHTL